MKEKSWKCKNSNVRTQTPFLFKFGKVKKTVCEMEYKRLQY